ncbi:MAG: hypothetical protein ABIH23_18395 [bacterium]
MENPYQLRGKEEIAKYLRMGKEKVVALSQQGWPIRKVVGVYYADARRLDEYLGREA